MPNLRIMTYYGILFSYVCTSCKYTPSEKQNFLSADRFAFHPPTSAQDNVTINSINQVTPTQQIPINPFTIEGNVFCEGDLTISKQIVSSQSEQSFKVLANKKCIITIEKLILNNLEFIPQIYSPIKKFTISVEPSNNYVLPAESINYQNGAKIYLLNAKITANKLLEFYISDTNTK